MANAAHLKAPADYPSQSRPYAPSWLDWITRRVRRLPAPAWLVYLLLALGLFLVETWVKWQDGSYALGTFYPFHFVFCATASIVLITKHYLEEISTSALVTLRPLLQATAEEEQALLYRLTTCPARPLGLASLIGGGGGLLLLPLFMTHIPSVQLGTSALAFAVDGGIWVWMWVTLGAAVYSSIHTVRMVNRIYTVHTYLDLFKLDPLYALTRPLALLTLSFLSWSYAWVLTLPGLLSQPIGFGITVSFSLLALATFILPLVGVHNLLVAAKRQLQQETAQRMKHLIGEAHRRLDTDDLEGTERVKGAMETLLTEEQVLARIPTWPWRPGTMSGLTTAVLLPIILWLLQWVLQHLLI